MKMKIAMLLALIMLCACTAASAQEYYTLPEIREQAAAGWHETYTDKYGRTIPVDLEIEVFGEDVAPVIKACWGDPMKFDYYDGNDPYASIKEARIKRGGVSTYPYAGVRGMKIDLDQKYAEAYGNDLTLREMYAFFYEAVQEQGIDQEYLWEQPADFTILYSANKKTGEVLVPALYQIYLWPVEFGLPIITHVAESFEQQIKGPVTSPTLNIRMRDYDDYSGGGTDFDVAEILADDIPLCSVEKVIEGARKMIEDGYIRKVLSLRFGYAVYSTPDAKWGTQQSGYDIDTWYLVPSWILDCRIAENPKSNTEELIKREVVINAQTGKMLDWFDKSLYGCGDGRYKGFISWDEVQ